MTSMPSRASLPQLCLAALPRELRAGAHRVPVARRAGRWAKGGGSVATGAPGGTPGRWVPVGPRSSRGQKWRSIATSANPRRPAQEIPAESPWRFGRVPGLVQTCPAPAPPSAPAVGGGNGRAAPTVALLGVPGAVTLQGGLWRFGVPTVLLGHQERGGSKLCSASSQSSWLSALGALVLYPFPSAVRDPSPPLGSAGWMCVGAAVGDAGDAQGHGDGEPCCRLPLAASQCCGGVSGFWVWVPVPPAEQPPPPPGHPTLGQNGSPVP